MVLGAAESMGPGFQRSFPRATRLVRNFWKLPVLYNERFCKRSGLEYEIYRTNIFHCAGFKRFTAGTSSAWSGGSALIGVEVVVALVVAGAAPGNYFRLDLHTFYKKISLLMDKSKPGKSRKSGQRGKKMCTGAQSSSAL